MKFDFLVKFKIVPKLTEISKNYKYSNFPECQLILYFLGKTIRKENGKTGPKKNKLVNVVAAKNVDVEKPLPPFSSIKIKSAKVTVSGAFTELSTSKIIFKIFFKTFPTSSQNLFPNLLKNSSKTFSGNVLHISSNNVFDFFLKSPYPPLRLLLHTLRASLFVFFFFIRFLNRHMFFFVFI